jgi:hypothetical protein
MILDALLSFVPIGGNLSVAGAAVASPNVIDLLGQGVGVAPDNIFGTPSVFGAPDAMGVGGPRPELVVTLGTTAWAGGTSLNVALQGAIDTGAAGGYLPGTWNTFIETGAILTANLTASRIVARFPWVPPFPENLRPRYLRLLFTPAGTFSPAGIVSSALVTFVRDDQFNKYGAKNYSVA